MSPLRKKTREAPAESEIIVPKLRLLIWLALGLVALGLAIRDVALSEVLKALAGANYGLVMLAFLAAMVATGATVFRWRLLLHPHSPRTTRLFSIFMIAHLLNVVLPAKLGTAARIYLAGTSDAFSPTFIVGSIAVEKVLDGLVVALLGVVIVPFVLLPDRHLVLRGLATGLWQPGWGTGSSSTLGEAVMRAKRNLPGDGWGYKDLIETYTPLGDPALQLGLSPQPE